MKRWSVWAGPVLALAVLMLPVDLTNSKD